MNNEGPLLSHGEPVDLLGPNPVPEKDRILPNSAPAEMGVLSCIVQSPDVCFPMIINLGVVPFDFYDLRHQTIFNVLCQMREVGHPIDEVTLASELNSQRIFEAVGGVMHTQKIFDAAPSAANLGYYVEVLKDKSELRRTIEICRKALNDTWEREHDPSAVLTQFQSSVAAMRRTSAPRAKSMKDLVGEVIDQLENQHDRPPGIPTGIADLDRDLAGGGLKPGEFAVIAARPSNGKTALCSQIVSQHARKLLDEGVDQEILFFSLEMTDTAIVKRMIGSIADVNMRMVEMNERDVVRLTDAAGVVARLPIHIDQTPGLTVAEISSRIAIRAAKRKICLVVIDYLQLIRPAANSRKAFGRREDVDRITQDLKSIPKDFNLALLCAAQLNRESEKDGRTPRMSDLRESGAIEQEADLLLFLHPRSSQENTTYATGPTPLWITIAKQREGPAGVSIPVEFQKTTQTFRSSAKITQEDSNRWSVE